MTIVVETWSWKDINLDIANLAGSLVGENQQDFEPLSSPTQFLSVHIQLIYMPSSINDDSLLSFHCEG